MRGANDFRKFDADVLFLRGWSDSKIKTEKNLGKVSKNAKLSSNNPNRFIVHGGIHTYTSTYKPSNWYGTNNSILPEKDVEV